VKEQLKKGRFWRPNFYLYYKYMQKLNRQTTKCKIKK